MVEVASSYKGVLKRYESASERVQSYFDQLPKLVNDHHYEVPLAYLLLRTEMAHNRALYCGVVRLHRADTAVANKVVNHHRTTRESFLLLYRNVFGHQAAAETVAKIKHAEDVRDRVIHGKRVSSRDMRRALVDVIDYAEALNSDIREIAGFEPFGDLRGFKGRAEPLDTSTTRWLLKGLGFDLA